MKCFSKLFKSSSRILMVAQTIVCLDASAVTQYRTGKNQFILSVDKLRPSLSPAVTDSVVTVKMPTKNLATRISRFEKDPRVEDVGIRIPKNNNDISKLVAEIARPRKANLLYDYFVSQYAQTPNPASDGSKRIKINKKAFQWIKPNVLADKFSKPHHEVEILTSEFEKDKSHKKDFLKQIHNFFSTNERRNISEKINHGENLSLEKDLLPDFARRMVKKFLVFRGPNCFHASLAFHGQYVTKSKFINVKEEEGYHRAMINYDELWRALNTSFYEVDTDNSPLQYGDMLVFFDLPKDHAITNFRWIRHAATYLIGPYTFSKGSKSSDSPYTVKTIDEEWATWNKFSKNLGLKVYRRTGKTINRVPPLDLTDWIY